MTKFAIRKNDQLKLIPGHMNFAMLNISIIMRQNPHFSIG